MREILLATNNAGKAREIREILSSEGAGVQVRWRELREFPSWPEPVENEATFMANAELKARHYAHLSGLWTIADDSGLEVDALGGQPGVFSARYAGEPKSDAANNALLVRKLAGVSADARTARFRCTVVLSDGQSVLASAEGTVEGRITDQPLGTNGFGYDPHFWIDSFGMTVAQMASEQKHAISHRGQALRALAEQLRALLT